MFDTIETKETEQQPPAVLAHGTKEGEPHKGHSREHFAEWMESNFFFYPKM